VDHLNQLQALTREALEAQIRAPQMQAEMLKFLRLHQGKEVEINIEIRITPKVENSSH